MIYLKIQKLLSKKGQGALEYLIIIGAAILVAVIVVSLIISLSRSNADSATQQNEQFDNLIDNTMMPPLVIAVDCNKTSSTIVVPINPSSSPNIEGYCLVLNGAPKLTNCVTGNPLTFTEISMNYDTQSVSIIAKRGNSYSMASMPAMTCNPKD